MAGKKGMVGRRGQGKAAAFLIALIGHQGDACVPWPYSKDKHVGRGMLGYNGVHYWAHRLMCELAYGPAPIDKPQVAHSCGKGHEGCVNPKHLSWANQFENQQDRRKYGTAVTTRTGNRSKLTAEQIAAIRALKGKQPQLTTAKQFGISHSNVRYWQGERDKYRMTPPRAKRA